MLVVKDKKALVVRSRTPERILTVIPTAKRIEHKGETYVAVPHRRDEVRVLQNLGIKAPAPMGFYYDWSGQYKPFEAQHISSSFMSLYERCYNLSGMGTGKSLTTLWAYDYLRSIGMRRKMLVTCPLSTMERAWGDEVFKHFPHLTFVTVYGDRKRRQKLLAQDADIYIVNHHGVKIIQADLAKREDIDIIIVDELGQAARNKQTDLWKSLDAVINKQFGGRRWAWGLTGTPMPNEPTDAWAQCQLIRPGSVPSYYTRFRDQVMRKVATHTWVAKDDAKQTVYDAMQPAIRFGRDECVDLPECMVQTLTVQLTPEQRTAYNELFTKMKHDAEEGQIVALNKAVMLNKLIQVACGCVYDKDGNEVFLPCQPRQEAVLEVIENAEAKVIVFVPFVSSIHHVADFLASRGIATERIYGDVPKAERDRIFRAFQATSGPRVLVAQPASMSHGLTLTQANVIVWYAPITSNDVYEQACARITRPGQKLRQFIVNIEGTPAERKIYARLRNKQKVQDLFLDLVASERED